MNAYARTGADLGAALTCQPRAKQTLFWMWTEWVNGKPVCHRYLVVPHGREQGDYWIVSNHNEQRLIDGATPEELGCERIDPDEEEENY